MVGSGTGLAPIPAWYLAPVLVSLAALLLAGVSSPWLSLRWVRIAAGFGAATYLVVLAGFGPALAVFAPDSLPTVLPWALTSYGGPALAAVVAGGEAAGLAVVTFSLAAVPAYRLLLGAPSSLTPFISDTQTGLSAFALCIIGGAVIRAAVRTDDTTAAAGEASAHEAQVRGALVARARSAAFVHDEVLVALRAAADGDERAGPAIQRQAQRALELAEDSRIHELHAGTVDWLDALPTAAIELDPRVRVEISPGVRDAHPDVETASAILRASRQALENSVRHAGAAQRRLRVDGAGGSLVVEVSDNGVGFAPDAVPPGRLGIRSSIVDAMRTVGGDARVRSSPGAGTTVTLTWSANADSAGRGPSSRGLRHASTVQAMQDRRFHRGVWVLVVLFYATQAAIACAVALRTPSGWVSIGVYLALGLVGAITMLWRQSSTLLGAATATGLVVTVALIGIALTPEPVTYAQAWFLPAAGLVLGAVALRLMPAPTIVGLMVVLLGLGIIARAEGAVGLELAIAAVRMTLLVILGALLAVVIQRVRRLSARASEQAIQAMRERAWDDATRRELERRSVDLDAHARPLLETLASGAPLSDADRARARAVEGRLRDGYRAAPLVREPLTDEVMHARLRGVDVVLLDDTEGSLTDEVVLQAVTQWMAPLVGRARDRFVGRLVPPGRPEVAHVVVDGETLGFRGAEGPSRDHGSMSGFHGE